MESGQTIAGKYRLNQLIGSGGMASVWSATNIFTEREFAIKVLLPQVAKTPEAARRFLLEAKVSARINHPNIIEIIDVGQAEDGSLFLVMELLTGQSLETAIRRTRPPMTAHAFASFMLDVAKALAAAHRSGVVHRDLKPTNIFLHKDRDNATVAKILDFGVSKILEDEQTKNQALTVAGTVLGSPLYMSPEQAMGAPSIDGRTDIFAFGAIMFEAMSGQRAYDAANFNALIVTIATKQPKSIDECAPQMPEALRAIVRDCMVTDRAKRIQSFDLVAQRIHQSLPALEQSGVRLPPPFARALPSDPDATAAMPVTPGSRVTDGSLAESIGADSSTVPPRSEQPSAFSAPWATPTGATPAPRGPKWWVVAGASGVVLLIGAVIVLSILLARRRPLPPVAYTPSATPVIATAPPSAPPSVPSAIPSADGPPVVSVDTLPVASAKGRRGTLSVSAQPGSCAITVDGVKQGGTPIEKLDLSAGDHAVECTVPGGKPRRTTVHIHEGSLTKYRFLLE